MCVVEKGGGVIRDAASIPTQEQHKAMRRAQADGPEGVGASEGNQHTAHGTEDRTDHRVHAAEQAGGLDQAERGVKMGRRLGVSLDTAEGARQVSQRTHPLHHKRLVPRRERLVDLRLVNTEAPANQKKKKKVIEGGRAQQRSNQSRR